MHDSESRSFYWFRIPGVGRTTCQYMGVGVKRIECRLWEYLKGVDSFIGAGVKSINLVQTSGVFKGSRFFHRRWSKEDRV